MFDVLVYLFETYYAAESTPDADTLSERLSAAGFENDDISDALDWLRELTEEKEEAIVLPGLEQSHGTRTFSRSESAKLSVEARGFRAFLETSRAVTPTVRESIIDRAIALDAEPVPLDQFKVIALMVLWAREGSLDSLILEELLPEGGPRSVQ